MESNLDSIRFSPIVNAFVGLVCLNPEGSSLEKAELDRPNKSRFFVITDRPEADLLLLQIGRRKADLDQLIPMNTLQGTFLKAETGFGLARL